MSVLCVCFLFGVGGSDRWFGTSVEDTAELPRSQGSVPVKPGGAKLGRGALSLSLSLRRTRTAEVSPQEMFTRSHFSASYCVPPQIEVHRSQELKECRSFPVHFYASAALQVKQTHVCPF